MKLFKNYKSKRQLREELAFMQGLKQTPVVFVKEDLIRLRVTQVLDLEAFNKVPIKEFERHLAFQLVDKMLEINIISFAIEDLNVSSNYNDNKTMSAEIKVSNKGGCSK